MVTHEIMHADSFCEAVVSYLYPPDSFWWILWIMHGFAATATVYRSFTLFPLEGKILQVEFSNLQDMFIITKAYPVIFMASF